MQKPVPANRAPQRRASGEQAHSGASQPRLTAPTTDVLRYAPVSATAVTGRDRSMDEIDKQRVRRAVLDHADLLQKCYEDQLQVDPDLSGRVQVSFVISDRGDVLSASATGLGDAVDYCVAGQIARIVFSPRRDGSSVVVNYPLRFQRTQPRGALGSSTVELGTPTVLRPAI